jgi:sugar (pentulose or hexulose) kinase
VLDVPITSMRTAEGAAHGAAILAAAGAGHFPSVQAAATALVETGETIRPGPDAGAYTEAYERYRALYPALAPTFRALGHAAG